MAVLLCAIWSDEGRRGQGVIEPLMEGLPFMEVCICMLFLVTVIAEKGVCALHNKGPRGWLLSSCLQLKASPCTYHTS